MTDSECSNFLALLDQAVANPSGGLVITTPNRVALKRLLVEARQSRPQDDPVRTLVFIMCPISEDRLLIFQKETFDEAKARASSLARRGSPEAQGPLPEGGLQPGDSEAGE